MGLTISGIISIIIILLILGGTLWLNQDYKRDGPARKEFCESQNGKYRERTTLNLDNLDTCVIVEKGIGKEYHIKEFDDGFYLKEKEK